MQENIKLSPNQMAHLTAFHVQRKSEEEKFEIQKKAAEEKLEIITHGQAMLMSVILEAANADPDTIYGWNGGGLLVRQPKTDPPKPNGLPQPDQTPAFQ